MKAAIEYAPGIRVLNQPFFETLITFIISRNNNIPRIRKIVNALSETYGTKVGDMYAFPTPQQLKDVSIEEYSELKMGFRAKYVYDAVQKILAGDVEETTVKNLVQFFETGHCPNELCYRCGCTEDCKGSIPYRKVRDGWVRCIHAE